MKSLSAILILLFFSTSSMATMSDQEFFNSIDLNYQGLDSVSAAISQGDTVLAKIKLLEYFQERTAIQYFPLYSGGSTSDANDNLNHYFTVVNIRKYAGETDGTVDWTTYDPNNDEWHYQFHRNYWLGNLGKVYGSTSNEIYAEEWIAELIDWIDDNSPGYPRTLDTGIRLKNWVESYQYFINLYDSPSITPEDHLTVLKSFIEQCRFLRDNWRDEGNWGATETQGLGAAVVMFPEFKFTDDGNWEWWRDLVIARMQHHLEIDFYPDGVQYETSPLYHSYEFRNLFLSYKLMNLNGITISEEIINLFVKPLEFMMHIHKPDGYLPQLSDTDNKNFLDRLEEEANLFGRQDMLYAATRGSQGIPPDNMFAPFPNGGYFVMRSDWGQNQSTYGNSRYLVFDTGSNDPWHAHYDILNFEAYAYGHTIIKDPGRYTYSNVGGWRDYFKNTTAHNTIVIDNQNQQQNAEGFAVWETAIGFDYVNAYHDAYNNIRHRRKVFFVKPEYWIISDLLTGSGTHTYDQYFHFEPYYQNHITLDSDDHSISTPHFALFPADQESNAEIISGWVSYTSGSKSTAPVAKYTKQGAMPVTFETLIYPFNTDVESVSVTKLTAFNQWGWDLLADEAIALEIISPSKMDYFCINHIGEDTLLFEDYKFSGEILYVRENVFGEPLNIQVVNGTSLHKLDTLLVETYGELANISWYENALVVNCAEMDSFIIWAPNVNYVLVNGFVADFIQTGNHVVVTRIPLTYTHDDFDKPKDVYLEQNYPNPFNSSTIIQYSLANPINAKLNIINMQGQTILTILNKFQSVGLNQYIWDGKNQIGQPVPAGVYIYQICLDDGTTQSKKMIFLK